MVQSFMLGLLFAAPWIVAVALLWPRRIRESEATPSLGELALRRLGA